MNRQGAADPVAFGPSGHRAWIVDKRPASIGVGSPPNCSSSSLYRAPLRVLGAHLRSSATAKSSHR
eukprot:1301365-Pyramimonas_sp.AAC.1